MRGIQKIVEEAVGVFRNLCIFIKQPDLPSSNKNNRNTKKVKGVNNQILY